MTAERELCYARNAEDVDGQPVVKQYPFVDQVMHAEYSKYVFNDDDDHMQLQSFPTDCTIWCAPGTQSSASSRTEPIAVSLLCPESYESGEPGRTGDVVDRVAYYVLPPCPDLVLQAMHGMLYPRLLSSVPDLTLAMWRLPSSMQGTMTSLNRARLQRRRVAVAALGEDTVQGPGIRLWRSCCID